MPSLLTHPRIRAQNGAALMVALVILVALTLLGLAAMSGNTLQQKMAYSAGQTNLAFQAAETGLAAGESWLEARVAQPIPDCSEECSATASIWPGPVAGATPAITLDNFRDSEWWNAEARSFGLNYLDGATPVTLANQAIPYAPQQPRYVIEELGKDPTGSLVLGGPRVFTLWFYRITARGTGAFADGPPTLVQSVYTKGF
ncbi:MAG: pilus assembly PilX family protein [Panacagrimonas sp.]